MPVPTYITPPHNCPTIPSQYQLFTAVYIQVLLWQSLLFLLVFFLEDGLAPEKCKTIKLILNSVSMKTK